MGPLASTFMKSHLQVSKTEKLLIKAKKKSNRLLAHVVKSCLGILVKVKTFDLI